MYKTLRNNDIRQYAAERGVRLWQVSERYGYLDEGNLSRLLRRELSPEVRQKLFGIIDELATEAAGEAVK